MPALHCICKQKEISGEPLIQCDSCSKWYHPPCLGINAKQFAKIEEQEHSIWVCRFCDKKQVTRDVYDVEFIVARRPSEKKKQKGKFEYRIRWKGYSSKADTWEPEENLLFCKKEQAAFDAAENKKAKKNKTPTKPKTPTKLKSPKPSAKTPSKAGTKRKSSTAPSPGSAKKNKSTKSSSPKPRPAKSTKKRKEVTAKSKVEIAFLKQHGKKAYLELKDQLDTFVDRQTRIEGKNLTEHQMAVYKETYVNIYSKKYKPGQENN